MTDVADEIRKIAPGPQPVRPPNKARDDELFGKVRAKTRGAIIAAHVELTGGHWEWSPTDDRILDIVDTWLQQKAGRT